MNSFYNDILNHENTYKQTFYIKYLTEFMILGFNKKLFNKNLIFYRTYEITEKWNYWTINFLDNVLFLLFNILFNKMKLLANKEMSLIKMSSSHIDRESKQENVFSSINRKDCEIFERD